MGNRITSREGFVSDNLVNLGRRLQINYDLKGSGAAEDHAGSDASASGAASAAPAVEHEKLAARRVVAERSEAERMYRELRDRIANSAAAAGAELEQLAAIRAELEEYKSFLDGAAEKLDGLDPNSETVIRDIEDIRFRYFTASGRAQAFFGGYGSVQSSDPGASAESKTFSTLLYESLPVVLAILFGSLIIGVAFFIALT